MWRNGFEADEVSRKLERQASVVAQLHREILRSTSTDLCISGPKYPPGLVGDHPTGCLFPRGCGEMGQSDDAGDVSSEATQHSGPLRPLGKEGLRSTGKGSVLVQAVLKGVTVSADCMETPAHRRACPPHLPVLGFGGLAPAVRPPATSGLGSVQQLCKLYSLQDVQGGSPSCRSMCSDGRQIRRELVGFCSGQRLGAGGPERPRMPCDGQATPRLLRDSFGLCVELPERLVGPFGPKVFRCSY